MTVTCQKSPENGKRIWNAALTANARGDMRSFRSVAGLIATGVSANSGSRRERSHPPVSERRFQASDSGEGENLHYDVEQRTPRCSPLTGGRRSVVPRVLSLLGRTSGPSAGESVRRLHGTLANAPRGWFADEPILTRQAEDPIPGRHMHVCFDFPSTNPAGRESWVHVGARVDGGLGLRALRPIAARSRPASITTCRSPTPIRAAGRIAKSTAGRSDCSMCACSGQLACSLNVELKTGLAVLLHLRCDTQKAGAPPSTRSSIRWIGRMCRRSGGAAACRSQEIRDTERCSIRRSARRSKVNLA